MVGQDPVCLRRFRRVSVRDTALLGDPGHDRLVDVGLVDGHHVLQDRGRSLHAHPGVHVLFRERRQLAVGMQLELHEHEVPELEEPLATRAARTAVRLAAAVLLTPVVVHLGVGTARSGAADGPEVLALGRKTMRSAGCPIFSQAWYATSSSPSPSSGSPAKTLTQKRSGSTFRCSKTNSHAKLDRAFLEVLAEREVAEHLEERQMRAVEPDLVDVRRPEALLDGRQKRCGRVSRPRKNGIRGCMPAVVSSVERSSARGTSGADGRKTWPLDSKNSRKPARSSADVRIP